MFYKKNYYGSCFSCLLAKKYVSKTFFASLMHKQAYLTEILFCEDIIAYMYIVYVLPPYGYLPYKGDFVSLK